MSSVELIKVFMGSPGDLSEERNRFPHIIDEVNQISAHSHNIHLEAIGWEDTLRGSGRPQSIINEELKTCDIVILNLWKRWGSPTPSFSSGFEEEYDLASKLNASLGRPEVIIYFRGNEDDLKSDEAEQIEKVINFRENIRREKKQFFQIYDDAEQWERFLRLHLCKWIIQYSDSFIIAKRDGVPFEKIKPEEQESQPRQDALNYFDYWNILGTPDSTPNSIKEIFNPGNCGSSINKILVSPDSMTLWAIIRNGSRNGISRGGAQTMLLQSTGMGYSWNDIAYSNLVQVQSSIQNGTHIWDVAIAPDDPNIISVVCANIVRSPLIQEVWLSKDRGKTWQNTYWPPSGITQGHDFISAIDISDGHSKRAIIVGTRDGTGLDCNNIHINKLDSGTGWLSSDNLMSSQKGTKINGDIITARFSPNFASDSSIVVIYCDGIPNHAGTWLATGIYDEKNNLLLWQKQSKHIKLCNRKRKIGDSPKCDEVIAAQIELPPDYFHLDNKFRRFYICIDAINPTGKKVPHRGIYRILNDKLETLMDTTEAELISDVKRARRISSIAYAPGKLIAGETMGFGDSATVHTWYMDVSNTRRISCWLPTLKPTSGAGLHEIFASKELKYGYGNARVAWSPDTTLAFVATGAASLGNYSPPEIDQYNAIIPNNSWPAGYVRVVPCDESALAITRNNGETWNQISLINTIITKLTDFACGTNNTTAFICTNNIHTGNSHVHSIWRSTINPNVAAPLPALPPIGSLWERVFHFRDVINNGSNASASILRTIWSRSDKPGGEMVGWALPNTKVMYWTPDYGDYWAPIKITNDMVDFVFEGSTTIYALYTNGYVQRIPYTGTGWATHLPIVNSRAGEGHCIAATEDYVFVGTAERSSTFALSFSFDRGKTWNAIPRDTNITGNVHLTMDSDFINNHYLYVLDDSSSSKCYRINIDLFEDWHKCDMGCPNEKRFYDQ